MSEAKPNSWLAFASDESKVVGRGDTSLSRQICGQAGGFRLFGELQLGKKKPRRGCLGVA